MRILVAFQGGYADGHKVPCYPWSYVEAFQELGHEVITLGDGHSKTWGDEEYVDLGLEIENGRNDRGQLVFELAKKVRSARSAVILVDSHGHPELHELVAKSYDHVFFAVWAKRDLFAGHPSAHWCPNATDLKWFGAERFAHITPEVDVGFFGSKKGLSRADDLVRVCKANGWSYDVRQVASNRNPNRWPATGEAMARCRVLFNRGQKHDGPNQRVMESMAMGRPLLTDHDPRDGMAQLFTRGCAYYAYEDAGDMEAALRSLLHSDEPAKWVSERGRFEVELRHTIRHRAAQILEVIGA